MKNIIRRGLPIVGILVFISMIVFIFGLYGIIIPLCIIGLGYIHHTK